MALDWIPLQQHAGPELLRAAVHRTGHGIFHYMRHAKDPSYEIPRAAADAGWEGDKVKGLSCLSLSSAQHLSWKMSDQIT